MTGHRRGIAQDDELHARTSNGDVHTAQVAQETDLSLVVGAHQRDDDNVALLPLETVYGVHGYQVAEGLEVFLLLELRPQVLHLRTIGRDDAHIQPLVQHPRLADLLKILLQRLQRQLRLRPVEKGEAFWTMSLMGLISPIGSIGPISPISPIGLSSVYPLHRHIEVEYRAVLHLGRTLHLVAIEPVAREPHNLLVHAILHLQQRHHLGLLLGNTLHKRLPQPRLQGSNALHRRGQLTMVASQDDARAAADGYPAGSLQGLCRLVYK